MTSRTKPLVFHFRYFTNIYNVIYFTKSLYYIVIKIYIHIIILLGNYNMKYDGDMQSYNIIARIENIKSVIHKNISIEKSDSCISRFDTKNTRN